MTMAIQEPYMFTQGGAMSTSNNDATNQDEDALNSASYTPDPTDDFLGATSPIGSARTERRTQAIDIFASYPQASPTITIRNNNKKAPETSGSYTPDPSADLFSMSTTDPSSETKEVTQPSPSQSNRWTSATDQIKDIITSINEETLQDGLLSYDDFTRYLENSTKPIRGQVDLANAEKK